LKDPEIDDTAFHRARKITLKRPRFCNCCRNVQDVP